MQDRRRRRAPQDQSPAAAEDENVHCRARPCVQERFQSTWQSGFATDTRRAGTETGSAGEPRSQPPRAWMEESWIGETSPHDPEGARPARFIKKVNDDVRYEPQPVARAAHLVLVRRCNK